MIVASRDHEAALAAGVMSPKGEAPVNEIVLTGDDIDLTASPSPKFWPGDGGRYLGTGDITFTRDPATPAASMSASIARCCTGPTASGFIARRASMAGSIARRGGRRASHAKWWPPTASIRCCSWSARKSSAPTSRSSMLPAASWARPIELTEAEYVSLPIPAHAEFVIEGVLHPGDAD